MGENKKVLNTLCGPTNLCQHSTTDLARGIIMIMTNECVRSALSFKHTKNYKQLFCIQFITNEQVKLETRLAKLTNHFIHVMCAPKVSKHKRTFLATRGDSVLSGGVTDSSLSP